QLGQRHTGVGPLIQGAIAMDTFLDHIWLFFGLAIAAVMFAFIAAAMLERRKVAAMAPAERADYFAKKEAIAKRLQEASRERQEALRKRALEKERGPVNPAMVCPHCQTKGHIRTKLMDRKKGVSGTKATAAVLTGGVSVLATGLSRTERLTRAACGSCGNAWDF